jgi:zinc protease
MTSDQTVSMTLQERPQLRPPDQWSFPEAETFTLTNGLAVQVFRRPGQYVVSAGLTLDLPLTAEARDLEGVATLTASTLDQGTTAHPNVTFADAVESCGAVLEASVTYSSTQLYLDVPTAHLAEALPLLAEVVSSPELTDADVERERGLHLAQIEQQLANGSYRADHALRSALFDGGFRSARMRSGEPATLQAVTGTDVRAFHAAHYNPGRATLVLAGDLFGDVRPLVEETFGSWTAAASATTHETPIGRGRVLQLIDRPGAVQADVRLGRVTIDRTEPRWADFQLAVHALGGAFLSRLNAVLREEKGYTYGVHAVNVPLRRGGYTSVQGSFRNEVVADAVSLMGPLMEVDSKPFTADEIERARSYLVGVQPLQYATASGVCNGVLTLLGAGLTSGFVDDLRAAYGRVTPASATAVAADLLPPGDMTLVVVGDATALADGLVAAGFDVEVVAADAS